MNTNVNLDMTRVPKELKLILKIITDESPNQLQNFIAENREINWELFLELAIHHRFFPLLFVKLGKMELI